MTRDLLIARLNSLCQHEPFTFLQAVSPFDFDKDPTGRIDQVFRIEVESQEVIGGFNYSEERTDLITIWIARKHAATPQVVYDTLVKDISSLTSAIVHDGSTGGGDFAVLDGGAATLAHDNGREFAVARLALPINYETTV